MGTRLKYFGMLMASAGSLVLAGVIVSIWLPSYSMGWRAGWSTQIVQQGEFYDGFRGLIVSRGRMLIAVSRSHHGWARGMSVAPNLGTRFEISRREPKELLDQDAPHVLGFSFQWEETSAIPGITQTTHQLGLPLWFVALVAAVPYVVWMLWWRRTRRKLEASREGKPLVK